MNSASTYLTRAGMALAAVVVAGLVLILVAVLAGPHLGFRYAVVRTGSMEPALPVGSMVVVQSAQAREVDVGDVITWTASADGRHVITHRVIEVVTVDGQIGFRTKGDANDVPDGAVVTGGQLRGRVIAMVPEIGKLTPYLQQRQFFIALVVVPAVLLIAGQLQNIYKELRPARPALVVAPAAAPVAAPGAVHDAASEVRMALTWVFGPDSRSDEVPRELLRSHRRQNAQDNEEAPGT